MTKRFIIIHGAPGVGKTSTCRQLYQRLENSVWLDGDWCWMMNPFTVTAETNAMVQDNITHLLRNFLQSPSFDYVIFNWVIQREAIFELLLGELTDLEFELHKITLLCSDAALSERMQADGRSAERIAASLQDLQLFREMDTTQVDTTNLTIAETVEKIRRLVE